jgi:tRNA (guanine-N7-)-methyltransferase
MIHTRYFTPRDIILLNDLKPLRTIRSFVKREGRLTNAQQRALDTLWADFGVNEGAPIDLNVLFDRDAPKVLEIGFGNGASLAETALAHPEQDYLGVEVHRPGVGHLLNLIQQHQIKNLRVACMDAVELLSQQIADNALNRVQLYFPDPWHKKKHHKRRIIQAKFVALLAEKITSGGYFHLATDWEHYAQHMLVDVSENKDFRNCATDGQFIPRPDYRPFTKFEQRGHRLGHGVWDLLFQRV